MLTLKICSLITSKVYSVARTMADFTASGRGSVCTWQSAYVFPHHDAVVLSLPTDRRISSRAVIGPEANLIPSKAGWNSGGRGGRCFVQAARLGILSPVPCRNRQGRRSRRRRRREGLARGEKNTGVLLSAQPGILHSLRLQEPQTRASIWASASRHLSLPHPSRRLASLVAAPPPPCSSSALLSCFASLLSFSLSPLRTLCPSLVSRFLFFSPKVDQTGAGRASIVPYRRPPRIPGRLWRWMTTFTRHTIFP